MRAIRVWRSVLGVQHTVIEKVELETQGEEEVLIATVRPTRSRQNPPRLSCVWTRFHVVAWATGAVDEVRRGLWNQLRRDGKNDQTEPLKNSRCALLKNPPDLTGDRRTTVARIAKTNHRLYRVYLLKEQLREVFAVKGAQGKQLLAGWLSWATRSRITEFTALATTIKQFLPLIHNILDHNLTNALSEITNTYAC